MIYKYRSITKETLDSILQNYVWMSNPNEFNDPFDSYLRYDYRGSAEEWKVFVKRTHSSTKGDSRERVSKLLDWDVAALEALFNSESSQEMRSLERVRASFLVCCFSFTNRNLLMWSHYADNHRGICLGYRTLKYKDWDMLEIGDDRISEATYISGGKYVPILRVSYKRKFVQIVNPVSPLGTSVNDVITTKFYDWKYEKECRIYKAFDGILDVKVGVNTLQEISMGKRIPRRDEEFVMAFVAKLNSREGRKVRLYKMELGSDSFTLRKVRVQ